MKKIFLIPFSVSAHPTSLNMLRVVAAGQAVFVMEYASKRVTVKNGRFSIKLRVASGKYKFVASASSTSKFSGASVSKKLTVK